MTVENPIMLGVFELTSRKRTEKRWQVYDSASLYYTGSHILDTLAEVPTGVLELSLREVAEKRFRSATSTMLVESLLNPGDADEKLSAYMHERMNLFGVELMIPALKRHLATKFQGSLAEVPRFQLGFTWSWENMAPHYQSWPKLRPVIAFEDE